MRMMPEISYEKISSNYPHWGIREEIITREHKMLGWKAVRKLIYISSSELMRQPW